MSIIGVRLIDGISSGVDFSGMAVWFRLVRASSSLREALRP
jgi:hypothetical protein